MSWQLAVSGMMGFLVFLFYWLSFQLDRTEHQILKLFYQMMGLVATLGFIIGVQYLIPTGETTLLEYYNMYLLIAVVLMILVFFYWFLYTSLSFMNGLLSQMWKDLRQKGNWRGRGGAGGVRLGQ